MDMKQADKTAQSNAECHTASSKRADTNASPEERHNMIATAAYNRAECRGFTEGCDQDDWLAAESEIDQRLKQD
jgi:hypothetical protein